MSTADNSNITVKPLTPCIGAEIEGVDLAAMTKYTLMKTKYALHEHQVLLFRDQPLTIDQQRAFTARFGPLMVLPYVEPMAEYPDVIAVLKEADEKNVGVFGGNWHSDFSFLEAPPMGSVLSAKEVPPHGGDTVWVNMCAAYDALPAGEKARLEKLTGMHAGVPYGRANEPPLDKRSGDSMKMTRGDPGADREVAHPVVCVHPDTGLPMLFINPTYTTRIAGMTGKQSQCLLNDLYSHCIRPEFSCRVQWRAHTVALWDNRCTMHYAVNDYDGYRRLMYRTTIAGERPQTL